MVTLREKDNVAILQPTGNIIGTAVQDMRTVMTNQIDTAEKPLILIDFQRVQKMDSGGLGTLMSAYKLARAKNGRIAIIHVGKNIKNLIVRSRLINMFEHFSTEAAAIYGLKRKMLKRT